MSERLASTHVGLENVTELLHNVRVFEHIHILHRQQSDICHLLRSKPVTNLSNASTLCVRQLLPNY